MRSVRFPPPSGPIALPTDSKAASLAGIASWSACRPISLALRASTWWFVRAFGPRLLPLGRTDWSPPLENDEWETMLEMWVGHIGPIDAFAVYEQVQTDRTGFALLAVGASGSLGFVKLRPAGEGSAEEVALGASATAVTVECPRVIDSGEIGQMTYLMTTAFPSRLHRPAEPETVGAVSADISRSLTSVPRPDAMPRDWEPMHGDFAPWNLRRQRGGGLLLFDFEHAGWAPPHADLVYYAAVCSALGLAPPEIRGRDVKSAVEYWRGELPLRASADDRDRRLSTAMAKYMTEHL